VSGGESGESREWCVLCRLFPVGVGGVGVGVGVGVGFLELVGVGIVGWCVFGVLVCCVLV
jgi:hypothetical protein